jgi:hypothetical protein
VFEFVDYLAILKELADPADRHRRVRWALAAWGGSATDHPGPRLLPTLGSR